MRRISIGIVGLLALIIAALALIAGYGSPGGGTPASPRASPIGVVTITLGLGTSTALRRRATSSWPELNKANPHIETCIMRA